MSPISNGTGISDGGTLARSMSEISDEGAVAIRFSVDLVAAAKRHLDFLRAVSESHWLHQTPTLLHAIRRYDELWMPLISDLTVGSTTPPMLLPPLDIQWVWHCHTLNPGSYRRYCELRFSKILAKPAIFDDENEEYALNRCRDIWIVRYPSEPFELEFNSEESNSIVVSTVTDGDLLAEVSKQTSLYSKFSEPYMLEIVYLIAARQRYKRFLHILLKSANGYCSSRLVPTSDIQLMWLTHQSYPSVYASDMKEMEEDLGKVVSVWDDGKERDMEETEKMWERAFDQPYDKAGATFDGITRVKTPVFLWEVSDSDFNRQYKSMEPRFLMEVCIFVRSMPETREKPEEKKRDFLRLRTVRCHMELKIDKPVTDIPLDSWRKMWHLYCEFGTRGVFIELRRRGGGACFKRSNSRKKIVFPWNDLLRAPSLTLRKEIEQRISAIASITPPVQAPYMLKCVPDRVTDDTGAMISDVILRMNRYRPQEGRWLSRTVLDHAGRECFVVRIRVGGGLWRRGGETPGTVKREERIIEIREGSWSYVAGSIGSAPEKVVGTARPKEEEEEEESRKRKSSWHLSTGDELIIHSDSSSSLPSGLSFHLENQSSSESPVRLLRGRKMHYQVIKEFGFHSKEEEEEEGFVTLVRFTPENPNGRATALLNWKLLVVELLPEEDAVLVLLLCMAILRSMSEMKREDMGSLLVRRRLMETKLGIRDWGSVIVNPLATEYYSSPYVQPWYWNAKAVMAWKEANHTTRQSALSHYSLAEGGDELYKRGVIT